LKFFTSLILSLILCMSVQAIDLAEKWPDGKTEKISYDLVTYKPQQTSNSIDVELSYDNKKNIFTYHQVLTITAQNIQMESVEKYKGDDLKFISSVNNINLPPRILEELGADSLVIQAHSDGDSIVIHNNLDPANKVAYDHPAGFTTSVGSLLATRGMDFKPDRTFEYTFINLLAPSQGKYPAIESTDSVIQIETVTVPAGTYECYKVQNKTSGSTGFSFYAKELRNLPVNTKLIDSEGSVVMELKLKEYKLVE